MTERQIRTLIEHELSQAAPADAAALAADVAGLAAVGLVEVARTASGELRISPRDAEA